MRRVTHIILFQACRRNKWYQSTGRGKQSTLKFIMKLHEQNDQIEHTGDTSNYPEMDGSVFFHELDVSTIFRRDWAAGHSVLLFSLTVHPLAGHGLTAAGERSDRNATGNKTPHHTPCLTFRPHRADQTRPDQTTPPALIPFPISHFRN